MSNSNPGISRSGRRAHTNDTTAATQVLAKAGGVAHHATTPHRQGRQLHRNTTPRGLLRQSVRSTSSPPTFNTTPRRRRDPRSAAASSSRRPTRATSPIPSLCRHARLAGNGTPQEIWHNQTGSPIIVRNNLNAADIDDINNHNNNNEEEEEECRPRRL
mmetsp:Transcript_26542/g.26967  ORF Transcript_26542/g.26967 Transcript_26542/m.26967 type:complete len:159 (-) Transcript_26542:133-609(-)